MSYIKAESEHDTFIEVYKPNGQTIKFENPKEWRFEQEGQILYVMEKSRKEHYFGHTPFHIYWQVPDRFVRI